MAIVATYKPSIKLKHIERMWINCAMSHYNGNKNAAAYALGITRSTLYRKLKEIDQLDKKQNVRKP